MQKEYFFNNFFLIFKFWQKELQAKINYNFSFQFIDLAYAGAAVVRLRFFFFCCSSAKLTTSSAAEREKMFMFWQIINCHYQEIILPEAKFLALSSTANSPFMPTSEDSAT